MILALQCVSNFDFLLIGEGKTVPDMKIVRQHLSLEGHIDKECLVELITQVTAVYSKDNIQK